MPSTRDDSLRGAGDEAWDDQDPLTTDPASSDAVFLRELARAPAVDPGAIVDLSGTCLGRYRLLSRLGRGAMGIVYAAEDTLLRRPVALKVLPPQLTGDPDRRRSMLREARSAAAAAHPNIAAIYDIIEIDEQICIAMERAEGRTLREVVAGGALPAREVARIGYEIAGALARAHEAGVIHRDLKPENIMIGNAGQVKILDFGVAKLRQGSLGDAGKTSTLTGKGQLLGTPNYMAPEQAMQREVDERSDLFSLGVILYEMATGERPFSAPTTTALLVAIERDTPIPPAERAPGLLLALSRVIERCLEKRPADRFPSAEALASALSPLLSPAPPADADTADRPADAPARGRSPRRLRGWLAASAALGAAGLLATLATLATLRGLRTGAAPPAPAPPSPLTAPGATLACPPLEAAGVAPPEGWLGAAAASLACRRARAILGGAAGAPARVLPPAALLDLPRQPRADSPRDPYGEPEARAKALAAARARAAAHLDGRVALVDSASGRLRVELALRDAAGRELGRGEGEGPSLHLAVKAAMAPLVRPEALPRAAAVDPEVATWSGLSDVDLLIGVEDLELAEASGIGLEEEIARLAPRRGAIGPRWTARQAAHAGDFGVGWDEIEAPPVDRSSPAAFARSAPVHAALSPKADAAALAEEARALASGTKAPLGRAALALTEAQLRDRAGDGARAAALALSVVQEDPTTAAGGAAWELLVGPAAGAGRASAARAYAAWRPEVPNAWNVLYIVDEYRTSESMLAILRRARILSPGLPLFAVHEGMTQISEGRLAETRAVAAELLSGAAALRPGEADDPRLVSGEYLLASVEACEGRLGAALSRGRRVLHAQPAFGRLMSADLYLLTLLLDLGLVLGQEQSIAEAFVREFMDPTPPRLYPGTNVPSRVASACALAPRDAARRCFTRLRALITEGFFREVLSDDDARFIDGAEAYARGAWTAAVDAWRPLAQRPGTRGRNLFPYAFDRVGDTDLAERIDEPWVWTRGPFNGAGLAHLRAARRALARGDRQRAEELARTVVRAWSVADAPVPALSELRALLTRKRG